jgi:N-carbamoylputrescine amidase
MGFMARQISLWPTTSRSSGRAALSPQGAARHEVRRGVEGGLEFWGASFVADPFGRVLARASHDQEEVLVVQCDLGLIDATRRNWPFLRDRRIDAYAGIDRRFID